VAIGVVNVTNSDDYKWTDRQALNVFADSHADGSAESLETTHGVIRLCLGMPFLYVSGIANSVGQFQNHVGANPYSQNFVAAHNASIATAWLLPDLAAWQQSL
jgi:hypothetical protein